MKTPATSIRGLAASALLLTGAAQAANDPTTGFYEHVRNAQLAHVENDAVSDKNRPTRQYAQAFGNAGGVLNTIWASQFQGFAHQPAKPTNAAPEPPQSFIADIRRIHFGHLDG